MQKAYEEMKEEGGACYREGKPELAELEGRTGIGRKRLSRMFRNGLEERGHGNCGKDRRPAVDEAVSSVADRLLSHGVTVFTSNWKWQSYKFNNV